MAGVERRARSVEKLMGTIRELRNPSFCFLLSGRSCYTPLTDILVSGV